MTRKQGKKERNPSGLATKKPIALRLMPNELEQAATLAKESGVSKSAHARQCYLKGREMLYPEFDPSSKPRAKRGISRGGAAKSRAAASLSK